MSDHLSRAETGIRRRVGAHNRQRAFESCIELVSGLAFTAITFAVVFAIGWFFAFAVARSIGVDRWIVAAGITALFAVVTFISAWRRADPLATVEPMTPQQWHMTMMSLHSPAFTYVSPRHAVAGFAALLLGGPANLLACIATWRDRMPGDRATITAASALLVAIAAEDRDAAAIDDGRSALLLRRLALIKIVPAGEVPVVTTTQAGRDVVAAG